MRHATPSHQSVEGERAVAEGEASAADSVWRAFEAFAFGVASYGNRSTLRANAHCKDMAMLKRAIMLQLATTQ